MDISKITISFAEIITLIGVVAWFIRLEARALQTYAKTEKLEKRIDDSEQGTAKVLERIASMEAKIDILISDRQK